MTPRQPQSDRESDRAHNLRIVGTTRIDIESLGLDWQPLESKLLAAAAYDAPRRQLYLRFRSGEVYRYFTFPAEQYQELLDSDSRGQYFLNHIRGCFPYERLARC